MCESDVSENEVKKKTSVSQITAALDYVRLEYANNIRVEELAKASHMSETHFRRVFESYMNMSPMDYINLIRRCIQIFFEVPVKCGCRDRKSVV